MPYVVSQASREKSRLRAKRNREQMAAEGVCANGRAHGPVDPSNKLYCLGCLQKRRKGRKSRRPTMACDECKSRSSERGKAVRPIRGCANCQILRMKMPGTRSYRPLDTVVTRAPTMLLRRLVRFDGWVSGVELLDSFGVYEPESRNNFSVALSRLFRQGCVERRRPAIPSWYSFTVEEACNEYRITDAGRRLLSSWMLYDLSVASNGEADLQAVIAVFGSLDVPELECAA